MGETWPERALPKVRLVQARSQHRILHSTRAPKS